jgi:hypothetical protein
MAQVFNYAARYVNRRRSVRGAMAMYLEPWRTRHHGVCRSTEWWGRGVGPVSGTLGALTSVRRVER